MLAERSIVNYELSIVHYPLSIVHCPLSIMNCPFLLRFSTQASLRAERSIVHCPFSIISCFLTLQSYNTGEAKSSILPKQRRAARVFLLACRRSALIVNRLAANGLSSFALAPLVLRLALCCYSVTVLQFQNGYYAGGERNKTNFYIYNIYIIYIGYYFACWNFFLRTVTL